MQKHALNSFQGIFKSYLIFRFLRIRIKSWRMRLPQNAFEYQEQNDACGVPDSFRFPTPSSKLTIL